MDIFGSHKFTAGQCASVRLGPLALHLTSHGDEWAAVYRYEADAVATGIELPATSSPPADGECQRWAAAPDWDTLELRPIMPDRSVVARPEQELTIPPATGGTFYVRVPVWLAVHVAGSAGPALCELPSVVLSKTWFGETTASGHPCYSLRTQARRSLEGLAIAPFRVVCRVAVENRATTHLEVERVCLQTAGLTIYQAGDHLAATPISVIHRGEDLPATIEYRDTDAAADWRAIGPARDASAARGIRNLLHAFARLKP
jgi:hypothetical protein